MQRAALARARKVELVENKAVGEEEDNPVFLLIFSHKFTSFFCDYSLIISSLICNCPLC